MSTLTISLKNQTALPSGYTVYMMGFSSTSQLQLTQIIDKKDFKPTSKASFQRIMDPTGNLNMFVLGSADVGANKAITEITLDTVTDDISGARIYFFFSKNETFPNAPVVSFTGNGSNVVNVPNPPNSNYAPYTYAEFTNSPSYGSVIDSQTVDGFTAPVTIEILNGTTSLGAVGNTLTLTRKDVISAFAPFINALTSDTTASDFLDLEYSKNSGGLLNPGAFLNDVSELGQFNNINSKLNNVFDTELNTFFSKSTLSLKGVSQGSIEAQVYTATSVMKDLPGTSFSQQALELTGTQQIVSASGESKVIQFHIFNPVGVCVLRDSGSAIKGSINDVTLTFENPLTEAKIIAGMSLQGMGIPANAVTVKKVNKTGTNITSVDLDFNLGTLPADSSYTFTPSTNIATVYPASIVNSTLTFEPALSPTDAVNVAIGSTVVGPGIAGDITIKSLIKDGSGNVTGAILNVSLGVPPKNSEYYFSKLPGVFLTSGNMVFANQGLFAFTGGVTNADDQNVLLNLQNQIVTAFNRGVANSGPTTGSAGYSSMHWGDESKWYPEGVTQNLFSLFMHTGVHTTNVISGSSTLPIETAIFMQDPNSAQCARGTTMGQAYGFAYDENPMFVASAADVPSKFDPAPADTTEMKITLGDWGITS